MDSVPAMTDGTYSDFLIGFYRKPKYPWETSVKPSLVVHFYELPKTLNERDFKERRRFRRTQLQKRSLQNLRPRK
jgi:hypothetical protein